MHARRVLARGCRFSDPAPPSLSQTDGMEWSYEVRGTHPRYKAPSAGARVSSRLEAAVEQDWKRTRQRARARRRSSQANLFGK